MKSIERYVFGAFLSSFALAFLVLSFVLTIGLMVQIVSYVIDGLPAALVGRFALVSFPETMQWTIPLGLLVSSVLVFSRLSADSEVAAMRACGVNLLTVMRWPLLFAGLCSLIGLFINNEIVPRGHEVRRDLARRISVGAGLELLEPGRTIEDFPNLSLFFEAKEGEILKHLTVFDWKDGIRAEAQSAHVSHEGRDLVLFLRGVDATRLADSKKRPAAQTTDSQTTKLDGLLGMTADTFPYRVTNAFKDEKYKRREKDYRFFEIFAAIHTMTKRLKEAEAKEKVLRQKGAQVPRIQKGKLCFTETEFLARDVSNLKTELMKRWVFAFASICFVLIGVPLGIRAQRRESTIGMGISLITALCYYLVVILMTSLSKNPSAHPECLIWVPVLLCTGLSFYLIPKNL